MSVNAPATFFDLIHDVATREMENVGADQNDYSGRALYIEATRRVQVWTFEHIAAQTEDPIMRKMFEELALNVARVPDIDLWMGEPGASGQ